MNSKFTNRLIKENSPYLLQHAHNPVDWFAWGEEALAKAKSEDKIILVSIGYSACHWCHVMERESFENEPIAKFMNGHFINIKIDREERPDLDHIYMDAVQAISGSGGWPLNVFLTPDAKPFFGGTYFPPVKAFNRSSWIDVLQGISQAWSDKRNEIESQAENLTEHLRNANNFSPSNNIANPNSGEKLVTIEQCDGMFDAIMKSADRQWGGFGNAPKFPQTFTIQYLMQYHYFTGNAYALKQALLSIDKMLMGGIYDHVGGGLARYSTDREWLAPHFEKMLYDNALLIYILCDACQLTADKKYEVAIRKTIAFVTNELMNDECGFYAALDADSEGEEGKFYVWQKESIDKILGPDSKLFCDYFDVTEEGNWEGKNILRILQPIDKFVAERKLEPNEFLQLIDRCLRTLYLQRESRIRPALDDKIILGWNALMLKAIAKASIVLQDDAYRNLAKTNYDFIKRRFKKDDGYELLHTCKNGAAKYPAFLDDYAYLITALIQLYKATFNEQYLKDAFGYCNYVIEKFSDTENVFFFFTHFEQKDVIIRKKEIYDGAAPSGNAVMAENLFHLAIYFDKPDWRQRSASMLEILSPTIIKYPGSFGIWATLLLQQLIGLNELAVIGTDFASVSDKIQLNYFPNTVLMAADNEKMDFPLLANRPQKEATLIYLCKNYACLPPFTSVGLLINEIGFLNKITT